RKVGFRNFAWSRSEENGESGRTRPGRQTDLGADSTRAPTVEAEGEPRSSESRSWPAAGQRRPRITGACSTKPASHGVRRPDLGVAHERLELLRDSPQARNSD